MPRLYANSHRSGWLNPAAILPYGLTTGHIAKAMKDFLDFLRFINTRLNDEKLPRLESIIMSANFSSLVGEFMNAGIQILQDPG